MTLNELSGRDLDKFFEKLVRGQLSRKELLRLAPGKNYWNITNKVDSTMPIVKGYNDNYLKVRMPLPDEIRSTFTGQKEWTSSNTWLAQDPRIAELAVTKSFYDCLSAWEARIPVLGLQGGSRSGKTFNVIPFLIYLADTNPGIVIDVVSRNFPHLRKGALDNFHHWRNTKAFSRLGIVWRESKNFALFPNGSRIRFYSIDNEANMRGPERDVLFINEGNTIDELSFQQLNMRTRGMIIIDFNPHNITHWVYDLVDKPENRCIVSTYQDNPFLSDRQKAVIEAEKEKDSAIWRVYGLGQRGHVEGLVFRWEEIAEVPDYATSKNWGLDYGHTKSPSALVRHFEADSTDIYKLYAYEYYMDSIQAYENLFISSGVKKSDQIMADRAEQMTNKELRARGWNVVECEKGPGSIEAGILVMRSMPMAVTSDSTDLLIELRQFRQEKMPNGKFKFVGEDHAIDACRYAKNSQEVYAEQYWY